MENTTAAILLASLLERIERDQAIGATSSHERQALRLAVQALGGDEPPLPPTPQALAVRALPVEELIKKLPSVSLVLSSIQREETTAPDALMCLDFGTAMSKAFASIFPDEHLDLALGAAAGRDGYALPSSIFIADDCKAYFGFEALEMSQGLEGSGRERLDSIKGWISLQQEGSLDGEANVLSKAMNPSDVKLTQGDLLLIYLAYFTDVAELALKTHVAEPRYMKRRYARPCWPDSKAKWGDNLMRRMLAEAQVLADTFSGSWTGGIDVAVLKDAVEQVKKLDRRPDYLIDEGVPEPVAVAAGAFSESENLRDAFMVVDVGAGTTDFGLFVSARRPVDGVHCVYQAAASIQGLMQAGDKVDGLLRGFIAHKESIDPSDNSGKLILADLSRRIRSLKEVLFKTGALEYTLSDDTVGSLLLKDFLADPKVLRFGQAVEDGFKKALSAVDESWLRWMAMSGMRLNVVLTGGSSPLPMMQALGNGVIEVNGHRIERKAVNPSPSWMQDMPDELMVVYPQLAVAIGGAAETMPQTADAPDVFGGGVRAPSYAPGNIHVGGK